VKGLKDVELKLKACQGANSRLLQRARTAEQEVSFWGFVLGFSGFL
jgi:hypothetical protein